MYPKFKVFMDKMLMPLSLYVQVVKDVNVMVGLKIAHVYVNE